MHQVSRDILPYRLMFMVRAKALSISRSLTERLMFSLTSISTMISASDVPVMRSLLSPKARRRYLKK